MLCFGCCPVSFDSKSRLNRKELFSLDIKLGARYQITENDEPLEVLNKINNSDKAILGKGLESVFWTIWNNLYGIVYTMIHGPWPLLQATEAGIGFALLSLIGPFTKVFGYAFNGIDKKGFKTDDI